MCQKVTFPCTCFYPSIRYVNLSVNKKQHITTPPHFFLLLLYYIFYYYYYYLLLLCPVQHPVTRSSRAIDTISTHEGQQKGCASSTLSDLIDVKHVPANVLFRQYYTGRPHSCVAVDPLKASALPLELRFRASKQLYRPIISGKKEIALPLRVS